MDQLKDHQISMIAKSYDYQKSLELARIALSDSKKAAILSGAGVSAESGISTFRDAQTGALWDRFDPDKLSSMSGFEEDPLLVWQWYLARIDDMKVAQPNDGHVAIAAMETYREVTVITQNVDDLHERGGSQNVMHLHGDLSSARCFGHCEWSGSMSEVTVIDGKIPE